MEIIQHFLCLSDLVIEILQRDEWERESSVMCPLPLAEVLYRELGETISALWR